MNQTPETAKTCPFCRGIKIYFFVNKKGYDLYKCADCNLIFLNKIPDKLNDIYDADYFRGAGKGFGYADYDGDKKSNTGTFNKYLDLLEKYSPQKGRLLDLGSATGFFISLARERGWEVSGVEISDYAREYSIQKKLHVVKYLENLAVSDNYFDAITALDIIEHILESDKFLGQARKILKPAGILIINTPDAGSWFARLTGKYWHLLVPPEHLYLFNKSNITQLLQKNGFEVLLIIKIGKKFTLRYIARLLANNKIKNHLFIKFTKYLEKSRLGAIPISINLRDNMFLIAKKNDI